MRITEAELRAVSALSGDGRYRYLVKRVVDAEVVFGLWRDGWALAESPGGRELLALWPAPEFALACTNGAWRDREARPIPLPDLLDELLPALESRGVGVAAFPTRDDRGTEPGLERLRADLLQESGRY